MERKFLSQILPENNDSKVKVFGWVHELRDFGGLKFIIIKDRTGFLQITLHKKAVTPKVFEVYTGLTKESCVKVEGLIQKNDQAPNGVEIIPEVFEVLGKADAPTPIDTSGKITSDLSVRLDYRYLDLRDPKKLAIFKVRSKIARVACDFFEDNDFTIIQSPKITVMGVESGAEMFELQYYGKKAFLSQSPQVYKQMMVTAGFERVFDFGTVFRAEKSHTTRHLSEFTGLDFEMGFIESEHDVMDMLESFFKYLIPKLKEECSKELGYFEVNPKTPEKIPRIEMSEAKKILRELGKNLPEEEDLDPEAERMLGKYAMEKYNEEFIFVYNYPWEVRPFYHMKPEGNSKGTKSFDLIWNGVEITTGAQREHRYDVLEKQAKEKGIEMGSLYDFLKYGGPPHGGVGVGLDRIVYRLLKLDNIKEGVLLPRDPERVSP